MKFFKLLLSMILLVQTIEAIENEDNEEIVVRLDTMTKLMPLYLTKFYHENAGFDSAYLNKLEDVLSFDLNHNGMTYTVKQKGDHLSKSFEDLGKANEWKALNIFYVIKVRIADKKMSARMFSVNGDAAKSVDGLPLTGDLSKDRKVVHQLADVIHKALFNSDGIATTRFLYTVKDAHKQISDIWEADYDGQNARQITRDAGFCVTPAYVPPKAGFAPGSFFYISYKTGQSKIYMASLNDGIGHRFNLLKGNQLMPAITHQRNQVAFISDYTGNPDLFIQGFSPESGALDKPQQIFSAKHATQGSPTFSPDGKRIAFVSNKDGNPRVYMMDIPAAGASLKDIKPQLISKVNRESSAPAWSPDGKKLAYCAMSKGARQIWIYDFDRREERQVTQGGGNKENPTWAPNSLHIIFNSTGYDGSELYLINLNQPEATKISFGPGEKHYPSWQPRL